SAGAPRHPQDLIGVAHPSRLLQGKSDHRPRAARPLWFHLGCQLYFCNGAEPLALPPRFQRMDFPTPVGALAAGALQPALSAAVTVTCEEVAAGAAVIS